VNGLSTSLPVPVQLEFLRAVPGLERATMTRPGYADRVRLLSPHPAHAVARDEGGSSTCSSPGKSTEDWLREAAGQGVVAGINAVRRIRGAEPVGSWGGTMPTSRPCGRPS